MNTQPKAQQAAIKTLEALGYTYHGGELWKPPLGKPAEQEQTVYLVWMKAHCAWMHTDRDGFDRYPDDERWMLYNAPPPRQPWVGLTEPERHAAFFDKEGMALDYEDYAWAIEAKLKEKNT